MNANGKYDTKECVGTNGSITVIKDFGLKNPYVGKTQLVNGAIDSDFAYYFTTSEGLPSAVASGAIIKDGLHKTSNNPTCFASNNNFATFSVTFNSNTQSYVCAFNST